MRGLPVKPLSPGAIKGFLERSLYGEGAILRSLDVIDPKTISLRLSVQDKQRGFDWIDIVFEMHGIQDAVLPDNSKLEMIDTEEGITLCFEDGFWGMGIGRYRSLESLRSSQLFLIGNSLKYEEAPFSG